ncbi:thio(seleno)oxazole modification radical SAM maturase SbtM [Desulfosediminicola sp.]|uniref:thio(seleno)oxazole modification radical SAM maturase SbtM n=1 Tax=Desulfosediminicola sp. TaxID=2886825 RepID=UPI003AF294A7
MKTNIAELPVTASYLPKVFARTENYDRVESLLKAIRDIEQAGQITLHPFIFDLARLEWTLHKVDREHNPGPEHQHCPEVNPTLEILSSAWSGLSEMLAGNRTSVQPGEGYVAVFRPYGEQRACALKITGHDLLAIKLVAEDLDKREVAQEGGTSVAVVENILAEARDKGLIHLPRPLIKRDGEIFKAEDEAQSQNGLYAEIFTLQWHVTQKCDLSCRHCYDRSGRDEMTIGQAESVLEQFESFCEHKRVAGQISFSGGNPLLYSHFDHVYQKAAEMGFMIAILGNPSPREQLEKLVAIKRPEFIQVSLEGLKEHNDYIRGKGHFEKTIDFLTMLREVGVYSMVMLTLTRHNLKEVLPLAELLRDKTNLFNFNRLSPVGEGAALETVPTHDYRDFLEEYMRAAGENPIMGLKDNLFNIIRDEDDLALTGGCTGFGCGAAFNFVSLLPDGEVHACRKFPSLIGNIHDSSLEEIYHSEMAGKYRNGSSGCNGCRVRRFCGGCLAVVQGSGGDPFIDIDPYCFISA